MTKRSFLIAPSFARLAAKAGGARRIAEGYFPPAPERSLSVRVEDQSASLVVASWNGAEEHAAIPHIHAAALLTHAAGKIDYLRTDLTIQGRAVHLDRIVSPDLIDLITIEGDPGEAERAFRPPAWFGAEVSGDGNHGKDQIALKGLPQIGPEIEVTDAALHSLLDGLGNPEADEAEAPTAPAAGRPSPSKVPQAPATRPKSEDDVEDDVIRALARSLGPQRR
jgi:CYTH domain-containing protein